MGRYSVITRGMCETEDMRALNMAEKCIYLTAIGLRRQNITGMIYITVRDLAGIVGLDEMQTREALNGDNLRNKLEFFADCGVLWIKDFIRHQFSGKLSPQQKKGIINRLMEFPDNIVRKFLALNRDKLNLSRHDINQFDFTDDKDETTLSGEEKILSETPSAFDGQKPREFTIISRNNNHSENSPSCREYNSPESAFKNLPGNENIRDSSFSEDTPVYNYNNNTSESNIYFTHSNTLSDTSKQEQEQEQDQEKEQQQDPEQDPEDTPTFPHNEECRYDDRTAVVPLDSSVSVGSGEQRLPTLDNDCKHNTESVYNAAYSRYNSCQHAESNISCEGHQSYDHDESIPVTEMEPNQIKNILINMGINRKTAKDLTERFDPNRIFRQIVWFPLRRMKSLGALVRAIEADWEKPYDEKEGELKREARSCALRNPGCTGGREKACGFCPNKNRN